MAAIGPPDDPAVVFAIAVATAAISWILADRAAIYAMRRKVRLLVTAVIAFTGVCLLMPSYLALRGWSTAPYGPELLWRGGTLTAQGEEYMLRHPHATEEDLVDAATGKIDDIWTVESIESRKLILRAAFPLAVLTLIFPLVLLEILASKKRKSVLTQAHG